MEAESMIGVGLAAGLGFVLYSLLFKDPEIADTTQLDKFNQKVARGELNFNKQPKAKQQAKAKAPVFIETKDAPEQQQPKKKSKEAASPLSPYSDPVKKTFSVSKQEKAKQVNKGFEVVAKKSKEVSASEKKKRAQLNKLERELEKVREADKAARDIEFAERRARKEREDAEKKEKADADAAKAAAEAEEAEAKDGKDGKKVDGKAAAAAELASKDAKAAQAAQAEKSSNDKIKAILAAQKKEREEKAKSKAIKCVVRNANPKPAPKPVKPADEEGEGSDNSNSDAEDEGAASPAAEEKGWNSISKADDFTSVLASEADENVSRRMAPAAFPELK